VDHVFDELNKALKQVVPIFKGKLLRERIREGEVDLPVA
jgi:hypothetical protein